VQWFLRKFLKIFPIKNLQKRFSLLWPIPIPRDHDANNLNLQYVTKVWCKSELFWPSGSWEDFWITPPYLCIFVIISPWRGSGPLFGQTCIPFTQGRFVPSLIEIGKLVLKKIFKHYFQYHMLNGFPYRGSIRSSGTMMWTTWICTLSGSFHVNLSFSDLVVLENKIFKWPHPIFVIISPYKRT
jgi:hypothetical protein